MSGTQSAATAIIGAQINSAAPAVSSRPTTRLAYNAMTSCAIAATAATNRQSSSKLSTGRRRDGGMRLPNTRRPSGSATSTPIVASPPTTDPGRPRPPTTTTHVNTPASAGLPAGPSGNNGRGTLSSTNGSATPSMTRASSVSGTARYTPAAETRNRSQGTPRGPRIASKSRIATPSTMTETASTVRDVVEP